MLIFVTVSSLRQNKDGIMPVEQFHQRVFISISVGSPKTHELLCF